MVGRLLVGRESAQKLDVAIVSGNFFDVFRTHASQGATFGAQAPGPREILLAHALWQSRFGGEPVPSSAASSSSTRSCVRVVGVMPAGFDFPRGAELWLRAKDDLPELPIAMGGDLRVLRDARYLGVVGRLRDGARLAARAGRDGSRRRGARAQSTPTPTPATAPAWSRSSRRCAAGRARRSCCCSPRPAACC